MTFDPTPHLVKVKSGQLYLPVKYRLMWLREEHVDAAIVTEMVHLDLDQQLAVFRAQVTIPNRGSATGYGSETEHDFPTGWLEAAETKAIGRALAALGFGTQFAVEVDEGERVVDSPVTPLAQRSDRVRAQRAEGERTERPEKERPERAGLKVVSDDRTASLRYEVAAGLAADSGAASKLPKSADEMSADELEKTLVWLRNRAKRQA